MNIIQDFMKNSIKNLFDLLGKELDNLGVNILITS